MRAAIRVRKKHTKFFHKSIFFSLYKSAYCMQSTEKIITAAAEKKYWRKTNTYKKHLYSRITEATFGGPAKASGHA